MRTDLLKQLLSIPTYTGKESAVIDFLLNYCRENGHTCEEDSSNVYITKGDVTGGFYPMVCAHTDSVHDISQKIEIVQADDTLYGVCPERRVRVGCGGDDKAGVFICLELLERVKALKVAFFWGEEHNCKGSRRANPNFLSDVGYVLEFDSPEGDIMSFTSDGASLFDPFSAFADKVYPVLDARGVRKWQHHPYTDVAILRRFHNLSCLNLPAGYYKLHSKNEYVNLVDVANSIRLGEELIGTLGNERYVPTMEYCRSVPEGRNISGLQLSA